jgi:hypothetical protein
MSPSYHSDAKGIHNRKLHRELLNFSTSETGIDIAALNRVGIEQRGGSSIPARLVVGLLPGQAGFIAPGKAELSSEALAIRF